MFRNIIVLVLLTVSVVLGQKGSITGTVSDKTNNETLIGASIVIPNTTLGAASDIDGTFSIKNLNPGTYTIRVSYLSYSTMTIDNIVVKAGEATSLEVELSPITTEVQEVVITAEALRNTETSVLKIQKNSLSIVDGISSELISKNNSSDGTDVLKRMTGVTISEGKFAVIRGVGDRYNNTMLNGANLPSTEPEKKSFSYDIIPANLIENVITSKTFTPDKPADFTGGLVQIKTVEFPSRFIFDVSASSGFNSNNNLKDFTTYAGGKNDWLGTDDGTRALPGTINSTKLLPGNFKNPDVELKDIGLSFKNNWGTENSKSPLNQNYKISFGNRDEFGQDVLIGYIASFSYSNSFDIKNYEKSTYDFVGPRHEYNSSSYSNTVLIGGLANFSIKIGQNNKFSFKNVYNKNAEDEVATNEGIYYGIPDYRKVTGIRYIERSLWSTQLLGEHSLGLFNGFVFEWNVNYSTSNRVEPDGRRYVYSRTFDDDTAPFIFLMDQSTSTRFFSSLDDSNIGISGDWTIKFFENAKYPTLKMGLMYDNKDRSFDARLFGFRNKPGGNFLNEEKVLSQEVDKIFAPENFSSNFIEIIEITKPADSYTSKQNILAGYMMVDFNLFDDVKIIAGARYEESLQELNSSTITNEPVNIKPKYFDVLPSLNVSYSLNDKMNLRAAYTKTLARPEFRELAPFSYYDFVTSDLVEGNPTLVRTFITNYDFRYEFYPRGNELIAFSAFYKQFENPIEEVLLSASGFEPIRSYDNAKEANNYGLEIEFRKSMSFLGSTFDYLSIGGNASVIQSKIKLSDDDLKNAFQKNERPMQGQSDYVFNVGLYYDDYDGAFQSSFVYNKVGQRIARVGYAGMGDVVELPRDQIDFSVGYKFFNIVRMKFTMKDILAQDVKYIQRSPIGDKTSYLEKRAPSFSVTLSYSL